MANSSAVSLSITWTWSVTGEFETSVLDAGTVYEVELPLAFNGSERDGWVNPLTLDLDPPKGKKSPPNVVYPASIPVNAQFQNFAFPSFTAQGSGKVNLYVSTGQNANLPSALLIADQSARVKGTQISIPLSIKWVWTVTGEVKAKDLKAGSQYQIVLPLTLNGDTYDGWEAPSSLLVKLPWLTDQPPPNTVYPKSIPLNGYYKDFGFPSFVAQKDDGGIQITASTTQAANLPSSLLISKQEAKVKEV